tara:strand:+ start:210 stop:470 length:261 start_codon:yes stop_codon:yes gene_type:complete
MNDNKSNGLSIAAMVVGIVSLWAGPLFSMVGIGLSIGAFSSIKKGTGSGKGMAQAGLWTSILSIVIWIALIIIYFIFLLGGLLLWA